MDIRAIASSDRAIIKNHETLSRNRAAPGRMVFAKPGTSPCKPRPSEQASRPGIRTGLDSPDVGMATMGRVRHGAQLRGGKISSWQFQRREYRSGHLCRFG